jgi:uncharacterized protein
VKIHIQQIPPEGLHLEEAIPSDQLDLPSEGMRPVGPLLAALDIGLSGGGLFATGLMEIEIEFDCVACLRPFRRTLRVDDLALQMELTGPETVDLTPYLREDTLLALPTHPRCDWEGTTKCPGPGRGASGTTPGPAASPAWDALNQLNLKPKE